MVSDRHAAFTERTGTVVAFDDAEGAGWVADDEGYRSWFHCTRIAGGARTIPVGAAVRYRVVPGPTGLEAVDVDQRQQEASS